MGIPRSSRPHDGTAMASRPISLDSLRAEIDTIDNTIHDLIMRRTAIVEHVRDLKKKSPVKIRPAREAQILYRLMARHRGPFPKREIARIWRELIVATLTFEGPFSLAVYGTGDVSGLVELARDQYGCFTPVARHRSAKSVVDSVRARKATLGILPFPKQGDRDPWLRHLAQKDAPRVIARLPFIGHGSSASKTLQALVICPIAQERTGRDVSYLAIEAGKAIPSVRLRAALKASRLPVRSLNAGGVTIAEIDDFVAADDNRLETLRRLLAPPVRRVTPLGGYAQPLTAKELRS
jgi:chorismate mutase-like protein